MRNLTQEETSKRWDEYYSLLNDPDQVEFKKEFERCTNNHTWKNSIRIIEKLAEIKDGDKLLDAGGGWGRLLLGILVNHIDIEITLLDYQKSALVLGEKLIGKKNNSNRISWEEGNIESLPYPDNHYDKIYSGRVFQHLNSPIKGAEELVRVLKPGGKFVIFFYLLSLITNFIYNFTKNIASFIM